MYVYVRSKYHIMYGIWAPALRMLPRQLLSDNNEHHHTHINEKFTSIIVKNKKKYSYEYYRFFVDDRGSRLFARATGTNTITTAI